MTDNRTLTKETETVTFGFETVTPDEKVSRVKGVFRSVADQYDLMNDLMSAGIHRIWKANTMAKLNPQPGETLLDVAGGTGDLSLSFIRIARQKAERRGLLHKPARAIVCDINDSMLMAGRDRDDMIRERDELDWLCGDAMALPLESNSVDAVTISFGIRNVADMDAAFREFRRVLKPGGRFACLEFSHMTASALQEAYDAYSFAVIPQLGEWITGDRASYQYLIESIRQFPKQEEVRQRIQDAGFSQVSVTNFTGGVAALHFGWAV